MDEIMALKSLLRDTDYRALKFAEGTLTESEYAETREKRAAWRARINELEAALVEAEEAFRREMEAVEQYAADISSGEINTATGEPWTLEDVPERWREAVAEMLPDEEGE